MFRIAAKYADEWNIDISGRARGPSAEFKLRKFNEYVREAGRKPDDIDRSWLAHILVREDDEAVQELSDRIFPLAWGESADMEDTQLSDPIDAREKGTS